MSHSIYSIPPLDAGAIADARAYVDSLAKPLGALGTLEELYIQLAGMFGERPKGGLKKCVLVFASDNGVHAQGISPVPQSVTLVQGRNIARGLTGMGALARCAGADIRAYDIGVNAPAAVCRPLIDIKLMSGTRDFTRGPAMTRAAAESAIDAGRRAARSAARDGYKLIGVGEMGICNTCTSSAVLSALTGEPPEVTVGRGAGLTEAQFEKKRRVVEAGLRLNAPDPADPIDALSKVGGLDICAMAGAYIGAAENHCAAIVDGFIGMVAAACAHIMCPDALQYMLPSHRSQEPAFMLAAKLAGLNPPLELGMRLGEGSGCPIMMQIIEDAIYTMNSMATFESAEIDASDYVDIRK